MTFSIVATDGTAWGVAVASKFLAVGSAVPAAQAGIGAIATQSWANLAYKPAGLAMLRDGVSPAETIRRLTDADDDRAERQLGIVDSAGQAATYTGASCHPWAGGVTGDGYAIQGNILVGAEVVDAMQRAWLATDPNTSLADRLIASLNAGDAAGGDRRGRQSAAIFVVQDQAGYGGGSDVSVDLRVDDHPQPVDELGRLLALHHLYFDRPDPATALALDGDIADEVRRRLATLGHQADDLATALADWAGIENYEERLMDGRIDAVLLDKLRDATLGS